MNEDQIAGLTDIITKNVAKYRNMEDMELEIDDLPNDVQVMLLDYVRKMFGNPNKKKAREPSPEDAAALDDDDFEPDRRGSGAGGNKRKKHKPMGKKEQQDAIDDIKNRLKAFDSSAISASESPTNSSFNAQNAQPDTSGDEESEESEED
jgi:bromodomain-containing factor 1